MGSRYTRNLFKTLPIILSLFGTSLLFTNCSRFGTQSQSDSSNSADGGGEKPASRLTLDGAKILDPSGNQIALRGFNWGDWGTPQIQDAQDNVAGGATVVRVLLRWWGVWSDADVDSRIDDPNVDFVNSSNVEAVKQQLQWAASKGLWVVFAVDSNCGQNGTQPDSISYCDPNNQYGASGHNFWTDRTRRSQFITVWKHMASILKDYPNIAMYEPLPEPNPTGVAQADVTEFYKEVIDAVTEVDPRTPFLIGPTGGAYLMSQVAGSYIPDAIYKNKIVYTGDFFIHVGKGDTVQSVTSDMSRHLAALTQLRDDKQVPVFVQQTGIRTQDDPTYEYLDAVLPLLDQNGVGWTWWTYRDHTTSNQAFGCYYRDGNSGWLPKPMTCSHIMSHFTEAFQFPQ